MKLVAQVRALALLEGASLLLLLFVAMPLKYLAHAPLMVRVVGSIHGLFVVLFAASLLRLVLGKQWSMRKALVALVTSFVPFGAFYLERSLREAGRRSAPPPPHPHREGDEPGEPPSPASAPDHVATAALGVRRR